MNILESIYLALDSVRANKLRVTLTLLSISIGVFAIIAAGSLATSINSAITVELESLGENSFLIYKMPHINFGKDFRKYRKRKPITYTQYKDLKDDMLLASLVSCQSASSGFVIEAGNYETDPDVSLIGSDENFFILNNVNVIDGRPFTAEDVTFNHNVAVIGNDIVVKLFPGSSPIGKKINIKNQQFTVIGTLEEKGALIGQSQDNRIIIPITQFLKYYASQWEESLTIIVKSHNNETLVPAIDEAIGILRSARNIKPWEENSFELDTNESITQQFASLTGFLFLFGPLSGIIALFAAGIGIMNIMLVSVKERTKEIGIRKAVGAKRIWIVIQFLVETITLCQLGGLIGMLMGLIAGAGLGSLLGVSLVIPVFYIVGSIIICTLIGIIFGSYPAWKAAKLDPIDALRYE